MSGRGQGKSKALTKRENKSVVTSSVGREVSEDTWVSSIQLEGDLGGVGNI